MRAGIAIDKWKLPTFVNHLTTAGYSYTEHAGVTDDTLMLKVETNDLEALGSVVQAANDECERMKS